MAQTLSALGFKGTGIVGLFVATGLFLLFFKPETGYADLFLKGAFAIGLILGLLGIFGVLKKLLK